MDSSSQDKNLPATQRKLDQARKDGQAPRSKDLSHLAVIGTGCVALLLLMPSGFEMLQSSLAQGLSFNARSIADPADMLTRLVKLFGSGIMACAIFAAIVMAASILSAIGAGGWIMSTKAIAPDFGRLNPIKGLGNLFSKQQVVNVAKLVFLSLLLGAVAWVFISNSIDTVVRLILQPSPSALRALGDWIVSGVTMMMLIVIAAAVIDVPLQAFFHTSKLKMSHQEVKQEHKESDGNPQLKGRMRTMAREMSQRASITAVPKADFILMNPTHFAVAMKYDDKTMSAPQVVSKGVDLMAMKIRDIAKEHAIPIVQSPTLARALYAHAEIDQPIPSTLFNAVAQVLAYVYRLKAAMAGKGPMPQGVPDPFVPPELDPLNAKKAASAEQA